MTVNSTTGTVKDKKNPAKIEVTPKKKVGNFTSRLNPPVTMEEGKEGSFLEITI